jgi:hypothetical protein
MGGDYTGTEAPQILIWAIKDPDGPNLDRIQIIKGWLEDGRAVAARSQTGCRRSPIQSSSAGSSITFSNAHHHGCRHDARSPIHPIPICLPNANISAVAGT